MQYIDDLISRTAVNFSYIRESSDSGASALLVLLPKVGSGDNDVLVFPMGFQNCPWYNKQKEIFLRELRP